MKKHKDLMMPIIKGGQSVQGARLRTTFLTKTYLCVGDEGIAKSAGTYSPCSHCMLDLECTCGLLHIRSSFK